MGKGHEKSEMGSRCRQRRRMPMEQQNGSSRGWDGLSTNFPKQCFVISFKMKIMFILSEKKLDVLKIIFARRAYCVGTFKNPCVCPFVRACVRPSAAFLDRFWSTKMEIPRRKRSERGPKKGSKVEI